MPGGYTGPAQGDLGFLVSELDRINRRLSELEIPTGTSMNSLVAQVQEAIAAIGTTVNAWLEANAYTASEIDAKIAAPGNINPANVTASGGVSASGAGSFGGDITTGGYLWSIAGRNNPVVNNYVAAYFNVDGRLAATPSSRRFKQDIVGWTPEWQAIFAINIVRFRYMAAVEELGDDAPVEVGFIAEELHELGLTWLVAYDAEGLPWTVAYERLAVALLPAIQDHERRLAGIEAALGLN